MGCNAIIQAQAPGDLANQVHRLIVTSEVPEVIISDSTATEPCGSDSHLVPYHGSDCRGSSVLTKAAGIPAPIILDRSSHSEWSLSPFRSVPQCPI